MCKNSLDTKFQKDSKVPVPLEGESYYHRHEPVKFNVKIEGTTINQYSATGKIFLTDKRLMFIAQEPSDGFETFHVIFADVVSSIISPSYHIFKKKRTFIVRITLRNDTVFIISLCYKKKDLKERKVFEDYYRMLLSSRF